GGEGAAGAGQKQPGATAGRVRAAGEAVSAARGRVLRAAGESDEGLAGGAVRGGEGQGRRGSAVGQPGAGEVVPVAQRARAEDTRPAPRGGEDRAGRADAAAG